MSTWYCIFEYLYIFRYEGMYISNLNHFDLEPFLLCNALRFEYFFLSFESVVFRVYICISSSFKMPCSWMNFYLFLHLLFMTYQIASYILLPSYCTYKPTTIPEKIVKYEWDAQDIKFKINAYFCVEELLILFHQYSVSTNKLDKRNS